MINNNIIELPSNVRIYVLGLDKRIVNQLIRYGIYTLEDLLEVDYEKLFHINSLGEDSILKIKECVHKYGLMLKNEKLTLSEVRELYRRKGKVMLEDLGLDFKVCLKLYRNDIYTIEEIMQYGEKVYNIEKMGTISKNKLKLFLEENNCIFQKKEYPLGDIETFNISTRVKNILYRQGINNIYQLNKCSYLYFKKIRNLGEKGLNEIIEAMHSVGIKFPDEDILKENIEPEKKQTEEKVYTIKDVKQDKVNIDEHDIEILKNQIKVLEDLKQEKEKLINEYINLLDKHNNLVQESCFLEQQILSLGGDKNELSRTRIKKTARDSE